MLLDSLLMPGTEGPFIRLEIESHPLTLTHSQMKMPKQPPFSDSSFEISSRGFSKERICQGQQIVTAPQQNKTY